MISGVQKTNKNLKFNAVAESTQRSCFVKTPIRIIMFLLFQRKVYESVVEDVISNVREAFLDEGVDEQVLQELKQV